MSDWMVLLSETAQAEPAVRVMRDRPVLCNHAMTRHRIGSHEVIALEPPCANRSAPLIDGTSVFAVAGRPWTPDASASERAPDAVSRRIRDRLTADPAWVPSGMHAIVRVTEREVEIRTDMLGSLGVYAGRDASGALVAVGTFLEAVALAAGRAIDFDRVSLAELLVFNVATFPATSRLGVTEIPPASVTRILAGEIVSEGYWHPAEPTSWAVGPDLVEQTAEAMAIAADGATRGCERVMVALSGGRDSRAILGAVPRERVGGALTYVGRDNIESRTAAMVAERFGVAHVVCRRSEVFYEELLETATSLLGVELRSNAHGLAVVEAAKGGDFDLLLGGQLADTLLKDHYMPRDERERWRRKGPVERAKTSVARALGLSRSIGRGESTLDRGIAMAVLTDEMRDAVRARRATRLADIRAFRPTTAEEWLRFWPASRQDDSAHTLGNTRIMPAETLFNHPRLIEIARVAHPRVRYHGGLTDAVYARFIGPSASVPDANTGLPLTATQRQEWAAARRARRVAAACGLLATDPRPWNATPGSWVDSALMQRGSPVWAERRARLYRSDALDLLDGIVQGGYAGFLSGYREGVPATTNHLAVQIAWQVDRLLHGSRLEP